jgi:hypothetical protein
MSDRMRALAVGLPVISWTTLGANAALAKDFREDRPPPASLQCPNDIIVWVNTKTGLELASSPCPVRSVIHSRNTSHEPRGVLAWQLALDVLIGSLDEKISRRAEARFAELLAPKAERMKGEHV